MHPTTIAVITGDIGAGKSTVCRRLAGLAAERGLAVAGILSPGRYAGGEKIGIDVLDLGSGERRLLAAARQPGNTLAGGLHGPVTPGWQFSQETIDWAAGRLAAIASTDLLLVDELGPLELIEGQGWREALDVLRRGRFRLAAVVIRPSLVPAFAALILPGVPQIHQVTLATRDALPHTLLT